MYCTVPLKPLATGVVPGRVATCDVAIVCGKGSVECRRPLDGHPRGQPEVEQLDGG